MKTARVRQSFWLSVKWRFNTPFLQFSLFFCTTPPFSCFLPPALQVPVRGVVKKSCVFREKNLGKILSVRGIVVPLHSLSENFPVASEKSEKEAIFDILQNKQQGSVPCQSADTGCQARYVDSRYNGFSKERKSLGPRQTIF